MNLTVDNNNYTATATRERYHQPPSAAVDSKSTLTTSLQSQPEPCVHSSTSTTTATTKVNNMSGPSGDEFQQHSSVTYKNHLTISIKNFTFAALLDTGACLSICSLDLTKRLKYSLKSLDPGELGILFSANGTGMKILGKVELPIKIEGLLTYHTFYVTDSVTHEIILGLEFLEKLEAKIDLKSKTVSFLDCIHANLTVISEGGKQFLSTKSTVNLEPMSESIISVSVPRCYPLNQLSIIEPLPNSYQRFCVARSITQLRNNHTTVCRFLNPTESVITIPRGVVIATIESIDDKCVNVFSIDSDNENVDKSANETCQSNTGMMLSQVERQKILADLGVKIGDGHLTPEEKEQIENLVVQYSDIFAKDMASLPPAKLEKFVIDTGSAPPIRQRAYKQSPEAKREIERQVNKMIDSKLVSVSQSPWQSPVILVKKEISCKCSKFTTRISNVC